MMKARYGRVCVCVVGREEREGSRRRGETHKQQQRQHTSKNSKSTSTEVCPVVKDGKGCNDEARCWAVVASDEMRQRAEVKKEEGETQVRYIFWERSGWAIGAPHFLRNLGEHR